MKAKKNLKQAVKDYHLQDQKGRKIKFSSLFGKKEDLILIHNMGKGCTYCTMWADGFNGVVPHLEDRAAFAVVSPDSPEVQKKFYNSRKWKFRMYSSKGSSFAKDMGFETAKGEPQPGVSVFYKNRTGEISRVAKDYFGPGDPYCGVWHLFDLLPGGPKGWHPQYKYR